MNAYKQDRTSDEIRADVLAFLAAEGVTYGAVYRGARNKGPGGDAWKCDAWSVSLTKGDGRAAHEEFDYYTGTGYRQPVKGAPTDRGLPGTLYREQWEHNNLRPVAPHPADVLYSLALDGRAAEVTFREWCSEYGYEEDSRKAFATYEACQKSADQLATVFGRHARTIVAQLCDLTEGY